jgi:hypothetical protein
LLGLHEFPDGLTDFEIGHFFSFEPEVKRAIMSRRSPAHRLAVAVHIGFVRMTGRSLDAFDALPAPVVAQLKQELQIPTPDLASVRVLYERRRTLFDHQRFAAEVANFRPLNDRRKRVLLTQLRAAAKTTLSTDRLLQHARRWLYDTRILIPAERTLRAVARRAESDCERAMLELIGDTIPATVRSSWLAELLREHPPYETTLDWVQRPPGKRSKKALDQVMAKIGFLHQLGVDQYSLGGISLEQQRAYARRVRRRRPAKWRRVKEPRRTLELVCFVRISLMQLTDVFLSMASMQGAAIFRKATEEVLAQRLPDEGAAKRLREVSRLADDFTLNEAQLRERLRELAPADLVRGRIAAQTRERLSRNARKTRPLLKRMLEIDLESAADAPLKAAVDVLRRRITDFSPASPGSEISARFSTWARAESARGRRDVDLAGRSWWVIAAVLRRDERAGELRGRTPASSAGTRPPSWVRDGLPGGWARVQLRQRPVTAGGCWRPGTAARAARPVGRGPAPVSGAGSDRVGRAERASDEPPRRGGPR